MPRHHCLCLQEAPDVGIPVHERSLKSAEVKACMLSGLYVMIMLVDKSKLGAPWPWSPDSAALYGTKPSYTGARHAVICGHPDERLLLLSVLRGTESRASPVALACRQVA